MKSPIEHFREAIAGFTTERLAAIDAKLADPNYQPPKVEWLDDPDPFEMNWEWLEEDEEVDKSAHHFETDQPSSILSNGGISPRRAWQAAGIAIAASLFLGALIGSSIPSFFRQPGNARGFLVASASVSRIQSDVRGNEKMPAFRISSSRDGFVTVIGIYKGMQPDDFLVDPERAGPAFRVRPDSPANYTFRATVPASALLFVVTQTQADGAVRRAFNRLPSLPTSPEEMTTTLTKILDDAGYTWMEIKTVQVSP